MPAVLDKCVREVVGRGHSEQSAFAICRTTLGLLSDGTEDALDTGITEEQMRAKLETALAFQNGPALIKEMVVAKPIGKFINGPDQKGTLDAKRIDGMVQNFKKYPRQVPIYLEKSHEEARTKPPADGWAEAVRREGGDMVVRAKLLGRAAEVVGSDRVRLASIGSKQESAYDGTRIGEVLDHIVISNKSYIKDLNIAALDKSGDGLCVYLTDFTEAPMAKEEKETKELSLAEVEAKHKDEIKSKDDEIRELREKQMELIAAKDSLQEQLDNVKADPEVEELKLTVAKQQLVNESLEIAMLIEDGLQRGVLKAAWCAGYKDRKKGILHTQTWFKGHPFWSGKLDLLKHYVEKGEALYRVGKTYSAGSPPEPSELTLTSADKDQVRALGHDPDELLAAIKAPDYKSYQAAIAKKD